MSDNDCDYQHASEQEWRRVLIDKIDQLEEKIERHNEKIWTKVASMSEWMLVYRILGMGAFALLCAWIGSK